MIRARRLCKFYGSGDARVAAVNQLDLDVAAEERIALLGRSGAGKTTLLNLLAGLDQATEGELSVGGKALNKMSGQQLAEYRRDTIGVIFQSFQLIPQQTAFQNVALPLILQGVSPRVRIQRVTESLERVGLADRAHHRPSQLSGGEQQRVAIARAIITKPPVLLADEPTGNLDSQTAESIRDLMLQVVAENRSTLVLITHDHTLAQHCADRILQLADGKVMSETTASGATS